MVTLYYGYLSSPRISIGNHMILSAIWNKKHEYIFQRPTKVHEPLIHVTGELHSFLTQSELSNFIRVLHNLSLIANISMDHCAPVPLKSA